MIDNVVLIVTGTLHERDVQVHPLPFPSPVPARWLRKSPRFLLMDVAALLLICADRLILEIRCKVPVRRDIEVLAPVC